MFMPIPNTKGVTCPRCGTVAVCMYYDGRGEYGLQMEPVEFYYKCPAPGCEVHFDESGRVYWAPHEPEPEISEEDICLLFS